MKFEFFYSFFYFQPISSSSSASVTSSPPFQLVNQPLLHQTTKPGFESMRHSLSNMSLSSRCSYDNMDENTGDIDHHPISYYTNSNHSKQTRRISLNQADNLSTNSAATLRTDSYRQAHPLQSFAFEYPKRPLLPQSTESNNQQNRRKLNGNKQYEISV